MTKVLNPLYGLECEMCGVLPDETVFCRLLNNNERLSYYIHKLLLNSKRMYKLIRDYNDSYHKNKAADDYLSFCIVKTIFTYDPNRHYVFVEDLGRSKY